MLIRILPYLFTGRSRQIFSLGGSAKTITEFLQDFPSCVFLSGSVMWGNRSSDWICNEYARAIILKLMHLLPWYVHRLCKVSAFTIIVTQENLASFNANKNSPLPVYRQESADFLLRRFSENDNGGYGERQVHSVISQFVECGTCWRCLTWTFLLD